jgi:4-amino-4-deoxy-L-arabinose transferase-like glycosyltransferase
LALWGGWLLTLGLVYSVASYFHPYNLAMLAPPICALAGIGALALWRAYAAGRRWMLPAAIVVTALVQAVIALQSPDWNRWLVALALGLALGAAAWLGAAPRPRETRDRPRAGLAAALGVLALLILPAAWASVPLWHYGDPEFPIAGPDLLDRSLNAPATTRAFFAPPSLTHYLLARQRGERYILAARYGGVAAPVMLATGRAVLTYGGYLGTDHILTVDQLSELVRGGAVRFFWLLPAQAGAQDQPDIEAWVRGHCSLTPPRLWQPPHLYGASGPQLYDCRRVMRHT